jgi:hypothetical protein
MESKRTLVIDFGEDMKAINGEAATNAKAHEQNPSKESNDRTEKIVQQYDFHGLIVIVMEPKVNEMKDAVNEAIELNLNQLSGCLNTMSLKKSTPTKTSTTSTKPFAFVKPNEKKQAKSDIQGGAAGLWAKNKIETDLKCFKTVELPSVVPPAFTEEDWKVFEQHMMFEEPQPEQQQCYEDLLAINCSDLITNREEFVCPICESFILNYEGVVLKGCAHNVCRLCLIDEINNKHDKMGQTKCPFSIGIKCDNVIEDCEVKALLGDDYKFYMQKIYKSLEEMVKQNEQEEAERKDLLLQLMRNSEAHNFFKNFDVFECPICMDEIEIGEGVILKDCHHKVCKLCIVGTIENSDDFIVKCPFSDGKKSCDSVMQDREVRGLLPADMFEIHLEKSLKHYEGVSENAYHCKTPDCKGFVEIENNLPGFSCVVCGKVNCIGCKTIHEGKNCQEYQDEINPDGKHQRENAESENAIKGMIERDEAMYCPRCQIPVQKADGCDYIVCLTCKLGICWITRKPRQTLTKTDGTVIEGCKCDRAAGRPCHPNCRHCH